MTNVKKKTNQSMKNLIKKQNKSKGPIFEKYDHHFSKMLDKTNQKNNALPQLRPNRYSYSNFALQFSNQIRIIKAYKPNLRL